MSRKSNFDVLYEFREYWRRSDEANGENIGSNNPNYPVNVVYEWRKSREIFLTNLTMSLWPGPQDGMVDLDETAKITVDDFHLRFMPNYQTYDFDETTSSLIITGESDKMGGKYRIIITPTWNTPSER